MKITALAAISAITGASAQLSKKPLRGGAKDLAEDEAGRILQGSMSMIQGDAEYAWDGKWPAPTTTTEATAAGDWADWKGTSKASKSTTSSKGSKDGWWSASPTVSNAPSSEKEWSAGKSDEDGKGGKSGKSSSKDGWWSAAPTVSNAPSSEKEWADWKGGKSGKSTSSKSGKWSGKDWWGGSWSKPVKCWTYDIEGNLKFVSPQAPPVVGDTTVWEATNFTATCTEKVCEGFNLAAGSVYVTGIVVDGLDDDYPYKEQQTVTYPVELEDGSISYFTYAGELVHPAATELATATYVQTGAPPVSESLLLPVSGSLSGGINTTGFPDVTFTGKYVACL